MINVTSHVARDLLQSASLFRDEAAVVWEYVVNSLQYVDESKRPVVIVKHDRNSKSIQIVDNGRGMDEEGLKHFFQMHGENLDRKRGFHGRGKFGTGKSAAFGIADKLTVKTIRNGLESKVELSLANIKKSLDGREIPVNVMHVNKNTDEPSGTLIYIEGINIQINRNRIIEYIERHLTAFKHLKPEVIINDHVCEIREPAISESHKFSVTDEEKKVLGDVELIVNVAKAPLEQIDLGIQVFSNPGVLVGIETGGVDKKEMGTFLFGEITVPALESFDTTIEPYNLSRDMRLNSNHPVVKLLQPFIGASLDKVRKLLVKRLEEEKKSDQAKRLLEIGKKISDLLNEDFETVEMRINNAISQTASNGKGASRFGVNGLGDESNDFYIAGDLLLGKVAESTPPLKANANPKDRDSPEIPNAGDIEDNGEDKVAPAGGSNGRSRPKGGFSVEYRSLGIEERRSKYVPQERLILINLDHPFIKSVKDRYVDNDEEFTRLTIDVAFSEYAIALVSEQAQFDIGMIASDALYEVRDRLDKVSRLTNQLSL